jgi:hypothetical protein
MSTALQAKARLRKSLLALDRLDASEEQKAYMLCKAQYEATKDCIKKEIAALGPEPNFDDMPREEYVAESGKLLFGINDAGEFDAALQHPYFRACNEIEDRWRKHDVQTALWATEGPLIQWAKANAQRAAKTHGHVGDWGKILPVFDKWDEMDRKHQETLLDICVRMAVEK